MKKLEYKTFRCYFSSLDGKLNELGSEGWEVVSFVSVCEIPLNDYACLVIVKREVVQPTGSTYGVIE